MAARLGMTRNNVLGVACAIVDRGDELTVAAVADELGMAPPSVYHHVPGGLDELKAWTTEKVLVRKVAKAINDEGWTCEYHEPESFAVCGGCFEGQTRLARKIIDVLP